jgi:hypothetical protein
MNPVHPWQSKLNGLGLLTLIVGIVQIVMDSELTSADVDKVLLVVIGALTVILRTFFTKGPTTFTPIKV